MSRLTTCICIAASLLAASAHGGVPGVQVQDARVHEGDAGARNLEFRVLATGPPRRIHLPYTLSDGTASAADGDYASVGGVITLAPRPAQLVDHLGAGSFSIPKGVAIAPNGDVLAVDGPNGRIHRFSSNGLPLQTFGAEGTGYGKLSAPRGLAVNAAGQIYVANSNGVINIYEAGGQIAQSWITGADCYGLAIDAAGNLYVSEPRDNRIQKFGPTGHPIATWRTGPPGEPPYSGPLGIAVDRQGHVYAAKGISGEILKFAPDGTLVATWTDTKGYCSGAGLHVDDAGNLFIADGASSRVVVLDDQGTFLCEWTLDEGPQYNPGEFSATGITTDGNGHVYVGSRYSASIAHFRWDRSEASILVPVAGDTRPELDEYIMLDLSSTPNANLVDATAIGTIVNDDPLFGADVPPVVEAVANVDASWARDVVIEVTARDPNGDSIGELTADLSRLAGATFQVTLDRKHGVLRWRPRREDVRDEPHPITFTARNAAVASTTTRVNVGSNLVLNSSFTAGLDGWTSHVGATVARVPGGRRDEQAARLTLPSSEWAGLSDSPNWASASGFHRRVVVGAWVRAQTNRGNVRLQVREYQGGVLLAKSTVDGSSFSGTFLTSAWRRIILAHTCVASGDSDLDLTIDAQGGKGESFDLDDVSIVSTRDLPGLGVPPAPRTSLSASLFPNPGRGRTVFEVFLPADDCLSVELYDLAGRRRAVIADGAPVPAGVRRFELRVDEGQLSPGIYWYRAWTPSSSSRGRVVLLR